MMVIYAVSVGISLVLALVVGVRLLRLARRTRGLPETIYGILCICFTANNLLDVANLVRPSKTLYAVYLVSYLATIAAIWVSTWQIFRPADRWVGAVCALVTAVLLAGLLYEGIVEGFGNSGSSATTSRTFMRIGMSVGLLWFTVEAWARAVAYGKRASYGLLDPMDAVRTRLWAISSAALFLLPAGSCLWGFGLLDANTLAWVHTPGALVAAGAMWVTFFPPAVLARRFATDGVQP